MVNGRLLHKVKADSFTVLPNPVPMDMLPTVTQLSAQNLTLLLHGQSPEHCPGLAFAMEIGDQVVVVNRGSQENNPPRHPHFLSWSSEK